MLSELQWINEKQLIKWITQTFFICPITIYIHTYVWFGTLGMNKLIIILKVLKFFYVVYHVYDEFL